MVTVQKSALQRLWKCFVFFSRKNIIIHSSVDGFVPVSCVCISCSFLSNLIITNVYEKVLYTILNVILVNKFNVKLKLDKGAEVKILPISFAKDNTMMYCISTSWCKFKRETFGGFQYLRLTLLLSLKRNVIQDTFLYGAV